MQTNVTQNNSEYRDVPVTALTESASNPRKRFDENSLVPEPFRRKCFQFRVSVKPNGSALSRLNNSSDGIGHTLLNW